MAERHTDRTVRQTKGAGRWFPGNKHQLDAMVRGYIEQADVPPLERRIVSALTPHAGYIYSGAVAGHTFRALRDNAAAGFQPETVVLLGLNHRGEFPGVALMDGTAIETPLGQTALDVAAGETLTNHGSRIFFNNTPHATEHSAENGIPFVQAALPDTPLVVGLMGDHDARTLDELVAALRELAETKPIVVVASTDMLHHADYTQVTDTDKATLERVRAMDHAGIQRTWSYANQTFCGLAPVLTAMRLAEAQGCTEGTVLRYRNSGDDFPESRGNWVVGYGAVVFCA